MRNANSFRKTVAVFAAFVLCALMPLSAYAVQADVVPAAEAVLDEAGMENAIEHGALLLLNQPVENADAINTLESTLIGSGMDADMVADIVAAIPSDVVRFVLMTQKPQEAVLDAEAAPAAKTYIYPELGGIPAEAISGALTFDSAEGIARMYAPETFTLTEIITEDVKTATSTLELALSEEDPAFDVVFIKELPTEEPTAEPTAAPTEKPTDEPTAKPTAEPTEVPAAALTAALGRNDISIVAAPAAADGLVTSAELTAKLLELGYTQEEIDAALTALVPSDTGSELSGVAPWLNPDGTDEAKYAIARTNEDGVTGVEQAAFDALTAQGVAEGFVSAGETLILPRGGEESTDAPTEAPTTAPTEAPTAEPAAIPAIADGADFGVMLMPEIIENAQPISELEAYLTANGYTAEDAADLAEQAAVTGAQSFVPFSPNADGTYTVDEAVLPALQLAGVNGIVAGDVIALPTGEPTAEPTIIPTEEPTEVPTDEPTETPTEEPTLIPTEAPTAEPTAEPTAAPTEAPATSGLNTGWYFAIALILVVIAIALFMWSKKRKN